MSSDREVIDYPRYKKLYVISGRGQHKQLIINAINEQAFVLAGVQLIDMQKEAMRNILCKDSISLEDILNGFKEAVTPPTIDYTPKYKPWKKEKFYY